LLLAADADHGPAAEEVAGHSGFGLKLFHRHGFLEQAAQGLIIGSPAQGALDIDFRGREQARPEMAGGGEAQAVAVGAVVLAHGADEAQLSLESCDAEGPGWAGGGGPVHRRHGAQPSQAAAHLGHGQEMALPALSAYRGHEFDEPYLKGMVPGQQGELQQFIIVGALEHHAVDLQGAESQGRRGLDARQHLRQVVPPGEAPIALPAQGVQAQVEVAQPGGIQLRGQLRKQHPIGGQANLFEPRDLAQVPDELHHSPAHQGFAPGDSNLADAHSGGHSGQVEQFLVTQDFRGRQLLPRPPGSAVKTAEIATVSDGNPQVIDIAKQNSSTFGPGIFGFFVRETRDGEFYLTPVPYQIPLPRSSDSQLQKNKKTKKTKKFTPPEIAPLSGPRRSRC